MSTQEYKISPKRSTHIRSRPDMASSNSFFVPPDPSRTRPELRSPVPPGDGRRQAAERPTASADSLGGVSPPRSQSPERLQRRNARRRRRPQLAGTGMAHGETVTPPHMDSPVARHRQDALRLHSRNTRASNPDSLAGPLLKLADVADRLTYHLGGDPGYGGLITRNPLAPGTRHARLLQSFLPYSLGQLDKRLRRPSDRAANG